MQKMTMEELVQFMNESEDEFFIRVELIEEDADGEEVRSSVD